VLVPSAPAARKKPRAAPGSPPGPELAAEEDDEDFDDEDVDWVDDDDDDEDDDDDDDDKDDADDDDDEAGEDYDEDPDDRNEAAVPLEREPARSPALVAAELEPPTPPPGDWTLPPLELLEPSRPTSLDDERAVEAQA